MSRSMRVALAAFFVAVALLVVAAIVMAHGAVALYGAIEDGRERGRLVAELQVDVAKMRARADVALGR